MSAWAIGFTFLFHAGKGGGGEVGGGSIRYECR